MKKTRVILAIIMSSMVLLALLGCNQNIIRLTFETNGAPAIQKTKVNKDDEYSLPVPDWEGHTFEGWFLTQDFSGEPIAKITAKDDVKLYAKWTSFFSINLALEGGVLDPPKLTANVGENILQKLSDYIPQKKDHVFGAWFIGDDEITAETVMPAYDVTLTARYKIKYTVEYYIQSLSGETYEKDQYFIIGYEYAGTNIQPSHVFTGITKISHASEVTSKVLSNNASDNVLKIYFDRKSVKVTYKLNYPDGASAGEVVSIVKFGESITVPFDCNFNGYYFAGWSTTKDGFVEYDAKYIESIIENPSGAVAKPDTIDTESNLTLYPIWGKGFIDIFGGDDYIFLSGQDASITYLCRAGIFFEGDFNSTAKEFTFRSASDEVLLRGKVFDNGSFCYRNVKRATASSSLFIFGLGLDPFTKIYFDDFNGITYSVTDLITGVSTQSKGTFYIDDNEFYVATFTSGTLSGTTLSFTIGLANQDSAFQILNEDEYEKVLNLYLLSGNKIVPYTTAYQIVLNGLNVAYMNMGSNYNSYYYYYDHGIGEITLFNSDLSVAQVLRTVGTDGYMYYTALLDATYQLEDSTLTLDGTCNATYQQTSGLVVQGHYTAKTSFLGGYIVTFIKNNETMTFLITPPAASKQNGTFEIKKNGYAEYFYKDEEAVYYAPAIILDESDEGVAALYGYTSNKVYEKISSGSYIYDEKTNLYVYTADSYYEANTLTDPFDLLQIKSFVFDLDTKNTNFMVFYWYSYTTIDEAIIDREITRYVTENGDEITLISGFAIYTQNAGSKYIGTYKISNGVITVKTPQGYLYAELDEENKTFAVLPFAPYSANEMGFDGLKDANKKLFYDGKGGVTYRIITTDDSGEDSTIEYVGTSIKVSEKTAFDWDIYEFQSTEMVFRYIQFQASSTTYFAKYNDEYNGTYKFGSGSLKIDGYSLIAELDDGHSIKTGTYYIYDTDAICMIIDEVYHYFDIKSDRSVTKRGEEYGTYFLEDNLFINGLYLEFDGYGKLSVFTMENTADDTSTKVYIDTNGTYTANGTLYTLTYKDNGKIVVLIGKRSIFAISTQYFQSFAILYEQVTQAYLNKEDWSVLILDGIGGAKLYKSDGVIEYGQYVLITDELLYYINNSATNASIYKYNNISGIATPTDLKEKAYYTKDLRSLKFSEYGTVSIDGITNSFYNVLNGTATIYRRAAGSPSANKYGFVIEDLGAFDSVKNYEGETYYLNTGFVITFTRNSSNQDIFPISMASVKTPLLNLAFSPTGSGVFQVSAKVMIGGKSYDCYVNRSETEMYILLPTTHGHYRFDIEMVYGGEKQDGSSNSTYSIISMRHIRIVESITYLYVYDTLGALYEALGLTLINSIGAFTFTDSFNEQGEVTSELVKGEFGSTSMMYDVNGEVVSEFTKSYSYDSETGIYFVEFTASDEYTYRIRFRISLYNHKLNLYGYELLAFTRVQTLQTEEYTVEVERFITGDNKPFPEGTCYNVWLKREGIPIESTESFSLGIDAHVVIARETDKSGKITSTTYYTLRFVELTDGEIGESPLVVAPYISVVVEKEEMTTVYDIDGKSFVDINSNNSIVSFYYDDKFYLVQNCTYNEETNTYSIVTEEESFTIKVLSSGEVEISPVTEETP